MLCLRWDGYEHDVDTNVLNQNHLYSQINNYSAEIKHKKKVKYLAIIPHMD